MCPFGPKCKLQQKYTFVLQFSKVTFLDTFWARKLPEFLVPSFKSSKTKVTVVFLIIKASATTSLVQVVRVDGPQPAFNLGATPTWRKRGLPSRIGGPHGNFSGLLSLSFPTSLIKSVTAIHHFQAKCTAPSVADGEWYHPTVAQ